MCVEIQIMWFHMTTLPPYIYIYRYVYIMTVISGTYVPAFGFQGFEKVKLKLGLTLYIYELQFSGLSSPTQPDLTDLFLSSGIDEGTFFHPCNWTDSVSSPTRCKKRNAWARAVPLWRAISPRRSERFWVPHAGRSKQRCPRGWCSVVDFYFSFRWVMLGASKKEEVHGWCLPCFFSLREEIDE